MTWEEVDAAVARGAGIILVAAATEQHGPHLPLGTDSIIGTELALEVARGLDLVVAPTLTYGYRSRPLSGGGQRFPGTTSVRATTLIAVVSDILREFERHGFRKIVLLAHHMENQHLLYEAAFEVVGPTATNETRVMIIECPYPPGPLIEDEPTVRPPAVGLDHASVLETSLMLHLRPELVHEDRFVDDPMITDPGYDLLPIPDGFTAASGVLSGSRGASEQIGERAFDAAVQHVRAMIASEFFANSD
jgi:creatinine amidohydrolase